MRRSFFKILGVLAFVLLVVLLVGTSNTVVRTVAKAVFVPMATSMAQTAADTTAQTEEDTVVVVDEEPKDEEQDVEKATPKKTKEGGLSIKIDESGIRIEGPAGEGGETDTSKPRIVFDTGDWTSYEGTRRYREKGSDIIQVGEDVYVDADELVRGDVVAFGGDVSCAGKVVGDVVVIGGNARMRSGAEVNGNVIVVGGELEEEPEVLIHGERKNIKDLNLSFLGFPLIFGHQLRLFELFIIPVKFFISLILSFLIILFLRERVVRSQEHVTNAVLKSFGAGFLVAFIGVFVVTFLTIVLLITLIGIPLAFVLIVSCVAVFIIADTVFVYALGAKINDLLSIQTTNPFAIVVVGLAVLYLPALLGFGISLLPFGGPLGTLFKFLGWFLGLFAFLAGLGALFLSRFGTRSAVVGTPMTTQANPD
jgi:hypothetical protein